MPEVTTSGLVDSIAAGTAIPEAQWAVATGLADQIVVANDPPFTALTDGLISGFRALAANATATPTYAPDGLDAHPITYNGGQPLNVAAIPGQYAEMLVRYNLAFTRWELLNPAGEISVFKVLAADDTGGLNSLNAQPWFPTAGGVTLGPGTYEFTGYLNLSRAAGTTSHTTSLQIGGTATISQINYYATAMTGDANTLVSSSSLGIVSTAAAVIKAASTSATEQIQVSVIGTFTVSIAGTVIPQFKYSAAPGGTPTVKAGSFFRATPRKNTTGTWA
jgi:hypothetical protein